MFNGGILAFTKRGTALSLQFKKNINLSTRFCKSKSLLRSVFEACPQAMTECTPCDTSGIDGTWSNPDAPDNQTITGLVIVWLSGVFSFVMCFF